MKGFQNLKLKQIKAIGKKFEFYFFFDIFSSGKINKFINLHSYILIFVFDFEYLSVLQTRNRLVEYSGYSANKCTNYSTCFELSV